MIAISPGLAQGCFELLDIVTRDAINLMQLSQSFRKLSGLSTQAVVDLAQTLGWFRLNADGNAEPTNKGRAILLLNSYQERLRQALIDYVDEVRPPWLQNALDGRSRVLAYVGSQIGQVFVEADVTGDTSDSVVSFWDALAARARGLKDSRLNEIGRQGERMTLAYEQARTGHVPKWVSIESCADGYDVLSIVSPEDSSLLSIEVKASSTATGSILHLTRNEWERALEAQHHNFHLWTLPRNGQARLAVLVQDDIRPHIPADLGNGNWRLLQVPFYSFEPRFVDVVL